MGTLIGGRKNAARRLGIDENEYIRRVEAGEKWCIYCRTFHDRSAFTKLRTARDGLRPECRLGTTANRKALGNETLQRKRRAQRARNASTTKAAWARRVAWLREGDVTADQLRELYVAAGGKCHYCQVPVRARFKDCRGFDHVQSRHNGGRHTIANLVVCCGRCNALKG